MAPVSNVAVKSYALNLEIEVAKQLVVFNLGRS